MLSVRFLQFLRRFGDLRRDESGNVAMMTALLMVPLIGVVGYGIDYNNGVSYKLRLDSATNAATLAGMDTARALLATDPNVTPANIKAAAEARARQVFAGLAPQQMTYALRDINFTRVGETVSGSVNYTATFPTTFANIVGLSHITFEGGSSSQAPLEPPAPAEDDTRFVIREQFDKEDVPAVHKVVFGDYNGWAVGDMGLELIRTDRWHKPRPPGGGLFAVEIDAWGNSSIAKRIYLPAGKHQLRYYYINKISYPMYNPVTICGTKPVDVDWATETVGHYGAQTNRIGVYLDPASTDVAPKGLSAANNNMIDVCVSSADKWIERSVDLDMKAAGFFWLTFQSEGGANDYNGGVIADIRLCRNACPGAVASTFPWANNTVLFKDHLELPTGVWPADYFTQYQLNNSGAATPESRWTAVPPGWTTSPINQIEFMKTNIDGRQTYVLPLDSVGGSGSNKAIHRKFLLAPGVYRMHWSYSTGNTLGANGTWCGLGGGGYANALAQIDALRSASARPADTNIIGFYVDSDWLRLHPEHASTLGAPAVWRDFSGRSVNRAQIPFHRMDACVHSSSPTDRMSFFHISKTGYYWISFRAEGTEDAWGGRLDNISLHVNSPPVDINQFLWIPATWPGTPWPGSVHHHSRGSFDVIQQ